MRTIDADDLANKVADLYTEGDEATEADKVVNDVIDLIDNAPTVEFPEQITIKCDAEEEKQKLLSALRNVKLKAIVEEERPHGKWIDTGNMEEYWAEEYQCSICGAKDHWHHYCPNCGAYMGESEDNDYEDSN